MNPETQGKLMVAMVVSIVAFGFGTGTILVTGGLYPTSNSTITPNTTEPDLPAIYTNQNDNINTDTTTTPDTPSNPSTPSTPSTPSNSTDGQDNTNNPPSSNNTTTNQ